MACFPIILSAPSGAGKTTVAMELLTDDSIKRVITATTRAPRKGEVDGVDYHFWTTKKFETAIKQGKMVEWAKVHVNYYGIPKSSLDSVIKKGKYPLLVIDVQGAKSVKKLYKDAISIFLAVPSLKELKRRINSRADGTKDVKVRLQNALKEYQQIVNYDYLVMNNDLTQCVNECISIITAEQLKTRRQQDLIVKLNKLGDKNGKR